MNNKNTNFLSPNHPMYKSGQILKTTILPYNNINQSGVNITSQTTIATYLYTPLSFRSNIVVEYFTKYYVGGNSSDTTDSFISNIKINNSNISEGYQQWAGSENSPGVGTRSGTIFPLMGSYTNTTMSPKTITISAYRSAGNDTLSIIADVGCWMKITEIYR